MNRSSLLRLAATVAVLGSTAAGYAPAALAATPTAHTVPDTVIPPSTTSSPRGDTLFSAGPGGFLHVTQGYPNPVWTSYTTGKTTMLQGALANAGLARGADVLARGVTPQNIVLHDLDTGTDTSFTIPMPYARTAVLGHRVVAVVAASGSTPAGMNIYSSVGGQQTVTPTTGWPTGASVGWIVDGDADGALMSYAVSGQRRLALVDLGSGQVTPVLGDLSGTGGLPVLSDQYVGWYTTGAAPVLHLVPRADPTAPETTLSIPAPQIAGATGIVLTKLAFAGGNALLSYTYHLGTSTTSQYALYQMPVAGGAPTPLLPSMPNGDMDSFPGGALAVGGTSPSDQGVHRFTAAADGSVASTLVYSDAQATSAVRGLAVSGGRLYAITGVDTQAEQMSVRTVQWGGTAPTFGAASPAATPVTTDCSTEATCAPPIANAVSVTQLARNSAAPYDAVQGAGTGFDVYPGTSGGTLVDANTNWSVYDGANGTQYIGTNTVAGLAGNVLWTRPAGAAALTDTSYEWAAGTTPGVVSLIDLAHQATQQTVQTGAPCVPTELQASADRWLYWSCGVSGPAGVYDLATQRDITVPSGYAELGDGYVVTHDESRGELVLTDVHTGSPVTSDLAALAAGAVADDRNVSWTVDKSSGGGVAYVDAQSDIHLLNPQVPASAAQPVSNLTLQAGEQLAPGASITAGFTGSLVMQSDGNLVMFLQTGTSRGPAIWSSNTAGNPGAHAVMQPDGNLVVYSASGAALWSSRTYGHPGAYATFQADGNFVVYAANGSALWASGTNRRPQQIAVGTVMKPGWWTQSLTTRLVMQADGNLVVYSNGTGKALWSSRTSGHPGAYAVMQPDGNLVVYRPGGPALWSSRTFGHAGAYAVMQDDGNFVVYRSGGGATTGGALWASGTNGN